MEVVLVVLYSTTNNVVPGTCLRYEYVSLYIMFGILVVDDNLWS